MSGKKSKKKNPMKNPIVSKIIGATWLLMLVFIVCVIAARIMY